MNTKQNINYAKHLEVFSQYWITINGEFKADERFTPIVISLYYALFHAWNYARFPKYLDIRREDLMQLCGIGNHITYTNALRTLEKWGLIHYLPSNNRHKASQIEMLVLTDAYLNQLLKRCESEQGKEHSNEQSSAPNNTQGKTQDTTPTTAPLYQTEETKKEKNKKKGGNSEEAPTSDFPILSSVEKDLVIEKVSQWCNYCRVEFLGLGQMLQTSKELERQAQGSLTLYESLAPKSQDFLSQLKTLNQRIGLYAQFVQSKPNDKLLREMFTPQGITSPNFFQQFEDGAKMMQAREAKVKQLPDKWCENFYTELLQAKDTSTQKRYAQWLKVHHSLEIYYNAQLKRYFVKKIA